MRLAEYHSRRAITLIDLSAALAAAGRVDDAKDRLVEARTAVEQKGNLAIVAKVDRALGALAT